MLCLFKDLHVSRIVLLPRMRCLNRKGIASCQLPTQEESSSVFLIFVRSQSLQYTCLPMKIPVHHIVHPADSLLST